MRSYFLNPHVHYCLSDGHVVFLDLSHDRYACLEPQQAALVAGKIEGLAGLRSVPGQTGTTFDDPQVVVQELLEAEIVTSDRSRGKVRLPPHVPTPELDLEDYELADAAPVRPQDVLNFFRATLSVWMDLSLFGTQRVFEKVGRRKRRSRKSYDEAEVVNLVRTFKRLRPLVFTTRDQCLFDSLALVRFLACYGVSSDLVIGVHLGPFTAHAWVQRQHVVLNDWAAVAATHTPILVI